MPNENLIFKGSDEFKKAIDRNKGQVSKEVKNFFVRAMAVYKRQIWRNPWALGQSGSGKGAPVDTGFLRRSHQTEIKPWQARIYPTARYADFIHDGTKNMKARPWLDQAKKDQEKPVNKLMEAVLDNIIGNLSK